MLWYLWGGGEVGQKKVVENFCDFLPGYYRIKNLKKKGVAVYLLQPP